MILRKPILLVFMMMGFVVLFPTGLWAEASSSPRGCYNSGTESLRPDEKVLEEFYPQPEKKIDEEVEKPKAENDQWRVQVQNLYWSTKEMDFMETKYTLTVRIENKSTGDTHLVQRGMDNIYLYENKIIFQNSAYGHGGILLYDPICREAYEFISGDKAVVSDSRRFILKQEITPRGMDLGDVLSLYDLEKPREANRVDDQSRTTDSPLHEHCVPVPCSEGVPIFPKESYKSKSYNYSGKLDEWRAGWVEGEDEIWFIQTSEDRYEFGIIEVENGWENPTYRVQSIPPESEVPKYEEISPQFGHISVEKVDWGVYQLSGVSRSSEETWGPVKFTFEKPSYFDWVF